MSKKVERKRKKNENDCHVYVCSRANSFQYCVAFYAIMCWPYVKLRFGWRAHTLTTHPTESI